MKVHEIQFKQTQNGVRLEIKPTQKTRRIEHGETHEKKTLVKITWLAWEKRLARG
jgi:hypothetical protein